jgi:parallel beta-helix repeat protein
MGDPDFMKTMCRHFFTMLALIGFAIFSAQFPNAFAQGSLTPPGAPAPTMKTLDQIEPRTPISALPYNITAAGSYYLTTNLTGISGANGITIMANYVTIDLHGFTLSGVTNALDGIYVPGTTPYLNLMVQNGTVSGWGGNGVNADNTSGARFSQLNVSDNVMDGLHPGADAIVSHCSANDNQETGFGGGDSQCTFESCMAAGNGAWGFSTFSGCLMVNCDANNNWFDGFFLDVQCTIKNCTAVYNGGDGFDVPFPNCLMVGCVAGNNNYGIQLGDHCTVQDCNASYNGADGINTGSGSTIEASVAGYNQGQGINAGTNCTIIGCASSGNTGTSSVGILAGDGCTIKDCVAGANLGNGITAGSGCSVQACTVETNGAVGIFVGGYSSVKDCTACKNVNNGIQTTNGCRIENNTCSLNGSANPTDGGILCDGGENRVDGNHLTDNNGNGLCLAATNNIVVRNSAKGNLTTNYSVGSGNDVGPIGSAAASTSPWANLQ